MTSYVVTLNSKDLAGKLLPFFKGDKGADSDLTPEALASLAEATQIRDDAEAARDVVVETAEMVDTQKGLVDAAALAVFANKAASELAVALAQSARDAAEDAVQYDYLVADAAALAALTGMTTNQRAYVRSTLHVWRYTGSAWEDKGLSPAAGAINSIKSAVGKNKLDKSEIRRGKYFSGGSSAIVSSTAYRCSGFVPVIPGRTYVVSGVKTGMTAAWLSGPADSGVFISSFIVSAASTAPLGATHLVVNITNDGQDVTTYDGTAQVEEGTVFTAYEAYTKMIDPMGVKGVALTAAGGVVASDLGGVGSDRVAEIYSFNHIDTTACNYTRRYSTGTKTFTADTLGIAASAHIAVEEGELYTISGDLGVYGLAVSPANCQGGYFIGSAVTTAHSNITFFGPVTGPGAVFQVPTGLGITHVVINLLKAGGVGGTTLADDVQLEPGEQATAYRAYAGATRIKPRFLPSASSGAVSATLDAAAWYKFTVADGSSAAYINKLPLFKKHWLLRDKDLCAACTGTSLPARSTEHCTDHPQAAFRPPLMHSNNFASLLWDRVKWDLQQYRRYDSAYFTETGAGWLTGNAAAEWDDGAYRAGLTRYTDSAASVAFSVPVDAWQFNFIYRTDSVGSTAATVAVAEGNGKLEVLNASDVWVEANGFIFSMREATPVTRSVSIPNPSTDVFASSTISSKGNTTYQKRLKMRAKSGAIDSRASTKAVTITNSTGRLMYWGVEWSPRQYMMTFVNAARGSHNTQATSATGLPRFQDNEIWSFKPDLLFFELPIHNDNIDATTARTAGYWSRLTNNFVFRADYELSLVTRGASFGLTPEIGMFSSSTSWNFGGIAADGTLVYSTDSAGKVHTTLDRWNEAAQWVRENKPDAVFVHATKRWIEAGIAIHGDMKTATLGSGKAGGTFTNEGSHWNDTGSKVMAKCVLPVFDFVP